MARKSSEELAEETYLSEQQAEIHLMKRRKMSHEEIADELGLEKGSIDAQSSRMNEKLKKAKRTIDALQLPKLHDQSTLKDGTPIGKQGALWHILDESGRVLSEGYHKIELADTGYIGQRGAHWYRITRAGAEAEELGPHRPNPEDLPSTEPDDELESDGGVSPVSEIRSQYVDGEIGFDELERELETALAE